MLNRIGLLTLVALVPFSSGCVENAEKDDRQKDKAFVGEKDKPYMGRPLRELVEELKDRDPKVRLNAARLLSYAPNKDAVPALCNALGDEDVAVAEQAAKGLRYIGPSGAAAVPSLVKHLKKPPSAAFREAAITALGGIGAAAREAVPQLVEQLRDDKAPLKARQAAATALGQIGPDAKAAVPALTEALAQPDLEDRAVVALIRMGKEARAAVPSLGKYLKRDKTYWLDLVRFLAEIDPGAAKAAIPDLRTLAASEPVRDQGIVNFRQSQSRIEEAKKLLKLLDGEK
jgi:HEAT repeats